MIHCSVDLCYNPASSHILCAVLGECSGPDQHSTTRDMIYMASVSGAQSLYLVLFLLLEQMHGTKLTPGPVSSCRIDAAYLSLLSFPLFLSKLI